MNYEIKIYLNPMKIFNNIDDSEFVLLGQGGFSRVYKTRIEGKEYAIKCNDDDFNKVCINEIDVAFRLRHDYLVHYEGVSITRGIRFVMKLADSTLFQYARTNSDNLILYFYQVALAIKFLHSNDILHLDVNPFNILIFNGIAKLNDFGLCIYSIEDYVTNAVLVTDAYRPPECWSAGINKYDKSVDVWSLGMTMIQCYSPHSIIKAKSKRDAYNNSSRYNICSRVSDNRIIPLIASMVSCYKEQRPSIDHVCKVLENILGLTLNPTCITLRTEYPKKKATIEDYLAVSSILKYCYMMKYSASDTFLAVDIYHRTTCKPENVRASAAIAIMRKCRHRVYSYEQLNLFQVSWLETKILEKNIVIELNGLINTPTLWNYLKNMGECVEMLECLFSVEKYTEEISLRKDRYKFDLPFSVIYTKNKICNYTDKDKIIELYLQQNANK